MLLLSCLSGRITQNRLLLVIMNKFFSLLGAAVLLALSCSMIGVVDSPVNPFIGSGGHGHVFVGANVPHGEVNAGPMNTTLGWDWCSGYHSSDSTFAGFAQTRLSGTGVADYGDILLRPQTTSDSETVCFFLKSSEKCVPGYYEVELSNGVKARVTASEHVAVYDFTYPKGEPSFLTIDLKRGAQSLLFRKAYDGGYVKLVGDRTVEGERISSEWAFNQPVWFRAEFSERVKKVQSDEKSYIILEFDEGVKNVEVKVAISQNSPEKLAVNLKEASSFEGTRRSAAKKWKKELGAIDFEGITPQTDTIFYTALYHTAFSPQLISDAGEAPEYTIFSLWDTYRAVHPLYNLIDRRAVDYCNSLLDIYDRTGRLPVWTLGYQETDCMVGVHSISVLCEAALKHLKGLDPQRVLKACSSMLSQPTCGMDLWDKYGYLPSDKVNWSVSVELEYCINAKCIALLARELGEEELAREFEERAQRYRRHFDPESGFMRGLDSKGKFSEPFDPSFSLHEEADYVEGNAWQYSFLVPEDVSGLAELYGGEGALLDKLDALFSADSSLNEGASADITGMIGQYAHGNEPSHHIIYLYSLLGRQDRAAELIRQVFRDFYSTAPDGLIGNEDCGQMSAWYVFSALGFYPVFPADGKYVFGTPSCTWARVHLSNGKTLSITAHDNSLDAKYVSRVVFNGKEITTPFITHSQIMGGGHLEYFMSKEK